MKQHEIIPQSESERLKAELVAMEKEDERQRARSKAAQLKIKKRLEAAHQYERCVRHEEFIKDKTPYWIGIERGWTAHSLRVVLTPLEVKEEGIHISARARMIEINCRIDTNIEGMGGREDGNFTMRTIVDGVGEFMNPAKWKNVSEQEFMEEVRKKSEPFFEMIKNATKSVFTLGNNLLGPGV